MINNVINKINNFGSYWRKKEPNYSSHDASNYNGSGKKSPDYFWHRYGHYQNSVDIDGKNYILRSGKGKSTNQFLIKYKKRI